MAGLYSPKTDQLYSGDVDRLMGEEVGFNVQPVYDYQLLQDSLDWPAAFEGDEIESSLERYLPLLPLEDVDSVRQFPLKKTTMRTLLEESRGTVNVKFESNHPSGSIRDRGSVLLESLAEEYGRDLLFFYGDSISTWSLGISCLRNQDTFLVFVPETLSESIIQEYRSGGMDVCEITCDEEELLEVIQTVEFDGPFYNATPWINPFFGEGVKTVAFETVLQLGYAPDAVILPFKEKFSGRFVRKGFRELEKLGWTDAIPSIYVPSTDESSLRKQDSGGPLLEEFYSQSELSRPAIEDEWEEIEVSVDQVSRSRKDWGDSLSKFDHVALGASLTVLDRDSVESVVVYTTEPFQRPTMPSDEGDLMTVDPSHEALLQQLENRIT